ncbi:MAG: carboxypeptidase-like regulatory domain-containing protein [Acidobacteriota bacterium]
MQACSQALARTAARTAGLWLIAVSLAVAAFAQGVTGTVSGTVKDEQGGVVPGATVTLISESRNTRLSPVVTNTRGDFVIPNVTAGTYTLEVEMPSFKTLHRAGLQVNAGSQLAIGAVTISVGGQSEVVTVTSEAPLIQSASGERSFTVTTDAVTNLPLANRSYDGLLALAPGVALSGGLTPASRVGGGGDSNFMLDGATAMDPGVNRPATRVSVEAIAEVKLATSTYQAEYGRSSGLQINAVTKSGSNRFHGSIYDVERNSKWNKNSQSNILNGDPKNFQDERDWGFSIGGPVGKPGGSNKLFFYFNQEYNPRTFGNEVNRFRVPTLLERQGDFSQSTDNNGALYNLIKDPQSSTACSSSVKTGCFQDGGVIGRIPKNRLYQSGLNILNWWPTPNITNPGTLAYNYEVTAPKVNLLGYQPIIRVDYQPRTNLRGSFKFLEYQQPADAIPGTIPGFNDSKEHNYGIWVPAGTINWAIDSRTFLEGSFGANYHHQEGCSITGGSPNYCQNGNSVTAAGNRIQSGFGDIPYLFPDATILSPNTFSYEVLNKVSTTSWDGTRVQAPPSFAWGNRITNAPPNNTGPFGNFILDTRNRTWNASLTRVQGAHTYKTGYYYFRSYQRRGQGNITGSISFANDTANPLDTTFGFANAAVGVFSTYSQLSRWGEGAYLAVNHEAFAQDNWRITSRVTLDYGLRFIHQVPQYDSYGFSSNFLAEKWSGSAAPALYVAGCSTSTYPCTAANRRATNPLTGQMLGPNSVLAIGTLVPNTGSSTNGVFPAGQGIAKTNYTYPSLAVTPRVGAAWDVAGNQRFVVRGGAGLFYDRPPAQNIYNTVNNPPFSRQVTVRYGQLQNLGSAGLTTEAPPSLTVWQYDQNLPASVQWNVGMQTVLPFSAALDVSYTGQHTYDTPAQVNINAIDFGTAFLPSSQNPAAATSASSTDPTTSYASTNPDLVRFYKGYGSINQQQPNFYRTYHSIQVSLNRRFRKGLLFGFNDTISLSDKQQAGLRLQHNADGTVVVRADQAAANALLGNNRPQTHLMRANFVWQLPKLAASQPVLRAVGYVVNDWSLSGIWSAQTGSPYTVGFSYQNGGGNVNLTGSPDYGARVRVVGDPGSGCSADPLRQFTTAAFAGPLVGSDGLESGNGYARSCFQSQTDLAIARTVNLGRGRSVQFRLDVFNAFNQAAITGRLTTMNLSSPSDPVTITNLPFDAAGNVIDSRSRPRGAGFGVATGYQPPRTMQLQARFSF